MVVIRTEYPSLGDDDFRDQLIKRSDYQLFKSIKQPTLSRDEFEQLSKEQCTGFEKTMYQHLMQHYMSIRSPYRSLLLYHQLGTGKTCSSITVAEAFLKDYRQGDEPSIIVVSTGTLQKSYEGQIFSISQKASLEALREQCTGDYYMRLIGKLKTPTTEKERESLQREIDTKIGQRYEFITYQKFATKIEKLDKEGKLDSLRDKVIIIDEAHNLRDVNIDQQHQQKALTQPLIKLLRVGKNNRLILLSATPMYNEPEEILWLLSLLCINDKRDNMLDPDNLPVLFENNTIIPSIQKKLKKLASEYISYVRGNNPFTFPVRLSPEMLGTAVIKTAITDNNVTDPSWPTYYKDGLVPTELGSSQLSSIMEKMNQARDIRAQMKTYEQMNCIAYNGKTGREWLYDMFDVSSTPTLSFKYRSSTPWLSPTPDMLGTIAAKMLRICEFVKTSTGIVVIYSNYNWSGIIPIALALEHVGFGRYGGAKLIDRVPISKKYPRTPPYMYKDIPNPQYVILSGNQDIMKGGKTLTELLDDVNSTTNRDGKTIKVVLITPIAREGLTIKNAREMHILNPWYNINNLEQVIGRVIRTCSHMLKPVEERNVSVYLHTAIAFNPQTGEPMDTSDLNSYRISARKLAQTNEVVHMIRDHAWDCSLMKNLNYMPSSTFDFTVNMKTSQGTLIRYKYGDSPTDEPQCNHIPDIATESIEKKKEKIRPDIYADIIPTIQARLRKYILHSIKTNPAKLNTDHVMIPIKNIPDILRMKEFPEVIYSTLQASLEKDGLLSGYRVFIHKDSLYVVPGDATKKGIQVSTHIEREEEVASTMDQIVIFEYINNISDDNEAVIFIYENLYADIWPLLADKIIYSETETMPTWIKRISDLLYREGALIKSSEYPSLKTKSKYIGYFDFFKGPEQIYILGANGKLGKANSVEITAIKSKRKLVEAPKEGEEPKEYTGMYVPYKSLKDKKMKLIFKILKKGTPIRATNPGIVCSSLKLEELSDLWSSLSLPTDIIPTKKAAICSSVSSVMLDKSRMFLPPSYKPNLKK